MTSILLIKVKVFSSLKKCIVHQHETFLAKSIILTSLMTIKRICNRNVQLLSLCLFLFFGFFCFLLGGSVVLELIIQRLITLF